MPDDDPQWLTDLLEQNATSLYRLAALLGAGRHDEAIVRNAVLDLRRRSRRLVDPGERLEHLQEMVVQQSRTVRGLLPLRFPAVEDHRQRQVLRAITRLPTRYAEPLVVSHYLQVFGPELAGILRMTVSSTNRRVEEGLLLLRRAIGETGVGAPGVVESLSQEVATALRSAAREIAPPDAETISRTLSLSSATEPGGMPRWAMLALAVALLLVGAWLGSLTAPRGQSSTPPQRTTEPSPTAVVSRSLPAQVQSVPVYYVGRADGMLYEELRDLPASGDVVDAALSAILALAPLDPDYTSAWGPGQLLSANLKGNLLTIDLTPEAYERLTPQTATQAVNQMVYTASALVGVPRLHVTFLADGRPPKPSTLTIPQGGFTRDGLRPMPALWLSSPKNGATVDAGQVTIMGVVKPGASTPVVRITNEEGKEVASTWAQTSTSTNADGWRSWSVTANLAAGQYQINAESELQEGGSGRPSSESKVITVR